MKKLNTSHVLYILLEKHGSAYEDCEKKTQSTISGFMSETFPNIDPHLSHLTLDVIISLLSISKPQILMKKLDQGIFNFKPYKGMDVTRINVMHHWMAQGIKESIFQSITQELFANLTMKSLEPVMKMLWFSKLPCFDIPGMTGMTKGENTFLKHCLWRGNFSLIYRVREQKWEKSDL